MEDNSNRILKSLKPYYHLFPKANFSEVTVKRNALVEHTVRFIPKVVQKTRWQVKRFVESELKNLPVKQACKKLWHFIKDHIRYQKDEDGKEQVQSPRRLIASGKGDCDCYTTFISTCLLEFDKRLKIIHRITKYGGLNYQHIYPVVELPDGEQIIMDCVVKAYNYEEPYTEKKDYTMDLNYLDGIESQQNEDGGELGKLFDFLKKKPSGSPKPTIKERFQNAASKIKAGTGKVLHAINRVNPATVLLRNGVLAAMKLNMGNVGARVKYAYLSDQEAQKRGMDMAKFAKLKSVMQKLENIFFGAGGKRENLKEAILTGKGNANKEVSGLGYVPEKKILQMNENTPLTELLGQEMYYSENMEGLNELGGLGEPITAVSIGTASGVIATLAALLKSIGQLFPKGAKGSEDFEEGANQNATIPPPESFPVDPALLVNPDSSGEEFTLPDGSADFTNNNTKMRTAVTTDDPSQKTTEPAPPKEGWFKRNWKWLVPTTVVSAIGVGLGIHSYKKKKKKGVNGVSGLKLKSKKKKTQSLSGQIKPVELM